MKASTKNAHVRPETTRQSPEVKADEAQRLLDDPAFKRGTVDLEQAIVELICSTQHDGSPECDAAEREMCRSLRTLRGLRRIITTSVQKQQLRLADFQSAMPDADEG